MSDNSFFTQATNFASTAAGSGVDPRTGLFNIKLPIAHLIGNNNLGPQLSIAPSYSPLTTTDMGFGAGFLLGLPIYDRGDHVLTLSSGEHFKVDRDTNDDHDHLDDNTDRPLSLRQCKLERVRFQKNSGADYYRLVDKSGAIVLLSGPNTGGDLKVPQKMLTAAGHWLALHWDFHYTPPRLKTVKDEHATLLTADYDDDNDVTTLDLLPGTQEEYRVQFSFDGGQLKTLSNLALGTPLAWTFGYDDDTGWITSMTCPDGVTESVKLCSEEDGHQFPESAHLPNLPYVTRFTHDPGGNQPAIVHTYSFTDDDFLGASSGISWDPNDDNLYDASSYQYSSTETRSCDGQQLTIKRTFNNYHLQIAETTQQNKCSEHTTIDYPIKPGVDFDNQPGNCQLPVTHTVTWSDGVQSPRTETTTTAFDVLAEDPKRSYGNLLQRMEPDGTKTVYEYYPAAGAGNDCPADPNGFVHFLSSVTRTPDPSNKYGGPVQKTDYRYSPLEGTPPSSEITSVVAKSDERHYSDGKLLFRRTFTYNTETSEYERLKSATDTDYPNGESSKTTYTATDTYAVTIDGDNATENHATQTYDGLKLTVRQTRSRFTWRSLQSVDPQGNVTEQTYDRLGRVLSATLNAQSNTYKATTTYAYELPGSGGIPSTITVTDPRRHQIRYKRDSRGQLLEKAVTDIDGGHSGFRVVETRRYDQQGRLKETDIHDYLDGASVSTVTKTTGYDDWWQATRAKYNDGVIALDQFDPIALTRTVQHKNGNAHTGATVITYDVSHSPINVAEWDGATRYSQRILELDGWHQVRREVDECGNATEREYDLWGRLSRTTLPDKTVLGYVYAPFSRQTWATDINLTDTDDKTRSAGTRQLDGLGRCRSSQCGSLKWRFDFDSNSDPYPGKTVTPDGTEQRRRYVPELNNAVLSAKAGTLTQQFQYTPLGDLRSATENNTSSVTLDYWPSGKLKVETFHNSRQVSTPQPTGYRYTLLGALHQYSDVTGSQQTIERDGLGRINRIGDSAVDAVLKYDSLERLTKWVVTDKQSGHALSVEVTLDAYGRELSRTITDSHPQQMWTITQQWRPNHQLASRTTQRGDTVLRDETYTYDERNRLTKYGVTGTALPIEASGRPITEQDFTYDSFGNITQCQTRFDSGGSDTATYVYDSGSDPCRLTKVTHSDSAFATQTLGYDLGGRVAQDEAGHALAYDPFGRLRSVDKKYVYSYDALDRLIAQGFSGGTQNLYYAARTLKNIMDGVQSTRLAHVAGACVAQSRTGIGAGVGTWLTATDGQGSVLVTSNGKSAPDRAYTPYGYSKSAGGDVTQLGFDGERIDPVTNTYNLGDGYRAYHPALMRFAAPDPLSPFGGAGVNPYAYCIDDPINREDPSGHLSLTAWLGIGLGVFGLAVAVATAPITGGMSLTAGLFLAADLTSSVTGILSGALEEASPTASNILGWVSLGTGLPGGIEGLRGIFKAVNEVGRYTNEVRDTLGRVMHYGLGGNSKTAAKAGRQMAKTREAVGDAGTSGTAARGPARGATTEVGGNIPKSSLTNKTLVKDAGQVIDEARHEDFFRPIGHSGQEKFGLHLDMQGIFKDEQGREFHNIQLQLARKSSAKMGTTIAHVQVSTQVEHVPNVAETVKQALRGSLKDGLTRWVRPEY